MKIICLLFFFFWCSYAFAIEFQQQVIDAWESHGSSAEDEFKEAHRLLEQLKKKARGASPNNHPVKALPLPHASVSSRSSEPDIPVSQNLSSTN